MLEITSLYKSFDGFAAISDVSLSVERGEIAAVIGPNGAGKSTLFNLITGHIRPDAGRVYFEGQDITGASPHVICRLGVGRSFQRANIFPKLTVFENVQAAIIAHRGVATNIWADCRDVFREETSQLLASLGLLSQADTISGALSYGNQKQLELGIALAASPKLLLLDEPTAGMSPIETAESVKLLQRVARERELTLLFTEHDMEVVFSVAHKIAVLHQGRIIAVGRLDEVRADPEVRRVYLGEQFS
jgi:ABC-type branched-chain amino acid transport systems, ATPase component